MNDPNPTDMMGGTLSSVFQEHADVMSRAQAQLLAPLTDAATMIVQCLQANGTVLVAGNGGSAADAQHFTAELVGRFTRNREAWPALAIGVNTSAMTAIGNDFGFDEVFAREVEAFAQPGDVFIAISTSGNSSNVVKAAAAARRLGCAVIAMTGAAGGDLKAHCDLLLAAPSDTVARVQEVHEFCLHAIMACIEPVLERTRRRGEES